MKKDNRSVVAFQKKSDWRRFSVAAALLSTLAIAPPSFAQDPASDEATLNFVGADIESVIKAIGHYTNTTFIIDPRVKGTINLVAEKPVDKVHAYRLLISALRLQGFTVVVADGYTKVVPEADAKLQVGPAAVESVKGDQIATQIYHLNYESATNLLQVLRPLISPNNTINANLGNNTLVITDYAGNLARLGKIIAALDGPSTVDMDIIPIKYAIATDIAKMVNTLLEPPIGGGPEGGRVTLTADSRTNAVLIKAPSIARANLAKSLIAKLDQPTVLPGNVHVVHLKNADAIKLAQTLRAVVASDASSSSSSSTPRQTPTPTPAPGATPPNGGSTMPPSSPQQSEALSSGGAAGYIQADQATNTLIITASDTLYRNLSAVIDQLDARRAEVYIESLVVEVTDTKESELGVQFAALSGSVNSPYRVGTLTGFDNSTTGNNGLLGLAAAATGASTTGTTGTATPPLPGSGLSIGLFKEIGGQLALGAIAHAIASDNAANILSMPNLITLDNEEATVIVGQNIGVPTGSFTTAAAGTNPFTTVDRKDIGLTLRVTPHISEGGTVKMVIYQESSSVDATTLSSANGPTINKRSVNTNVLVDDGQIIVLGGLIEDSVSDTNEQVPVLGDIPVIGQFFKYKTRSRAKTNLMIFLRPIVIRNEEQSANVTADRYDYMRNEQKGTQPEKSMVLQNMSAPVLPQDEKGVVGGGGLVKIVPSTGSGSKSGAPEMPLIDLRQRTDPNMAHPDSTKSQADPTKPQQ